LDDQLSGLPIARQFKEVFEELNEGKTKEAIIAGDADLLDMAIQSKIYAENGNKKAALWSESIKNKFATRSAKEIFSALEAAGSEDWWMELEAIKNKFESSREIK
jgi:5'-deoxynucleotidase YfbR-like HD superfamily hydrolase